MSRAIARLARPLQRAANAPHRTISRMRVLVVPGRAWLEFQVIPEGEGCRLIQTAYFEPKGLPGLAYWYLADRATALAHGATRQPAR